MSLRFCTLYSGSSANACYVEADGKGILIDAGAPLRTTADALLSVGASLEKVFAVFVTHEHTDHIGGLLPLLRRRQIPLFASEGTLCGIRRAYPAVDDTLFVTLPSGSTADCGLFKVTAFDISHDTAEPQGFRIEHNGTALAFLTDTGFLPEKAFPFIEGCRYAVLEANHDPAMLRTGPYPYHLKKRISGDKGHLSNEAAAEVALRLAKSGTEKFILAHLSAENNTPFLALKTVGEALLSNGIDARVEVAPRFAPSPIFSEEESECRL